MKEKLHVRLLSKIVESKLFTKVDPLLRKTNDFHVRNKDTTKLVGALLDKFTYIIILLLIISISLYDFNASKNRAAIISSFETTAVLPHLANELDVPQEDIYLTLEEKPYELHFLDFVSISDSAYYVYNVHVKEKGEYIFKFNFTPQDYVADIQLIPVN
ncbi:hypothetical protein HNQ94_001198 [Salirhabdus euzebyi]|uniref:Uncharacterized protein n=1 Tax=Salirhabdus euzebyi TaxID=394506 RepID=A0A841Q2E7_9BACI|nr:hypothetical protein [Salirhabdus euzebyi]MBB6452752.1 hypothetical protein [Salirhabdus euzebyi]